MRRVARAEQGVRTAAEPTETVASTSRTVERHRVSAIATGGRVVGPRRYRSASAIARSLRQASATASPRARAASSCTSAGSRRSKKRRFLQNRDLPRVGIGIFCPWRAAVCALELNCMGRGHRGTAVAAAHAVQFQRTDRGPPGTKDADPHSGQISILQKAALFRASRPRRCTRRRCACSGARGS